MNLNLDHVTAHTPSITDQMADFLRVHHPHFEPGFQAELPQARDEITGRVLAALHIEELPEDSEAQLLADIDNATANRALATVMARHGRANVRAGLFASEYARSAAASFAATNPGWGSGDPTSINMALERLCTDGHNLHPLGRARFDFTPADSHAYATEGPGLVDVATLAVHKRLLCHTRDDAGRSISDILHTQFPQIRAHLPPESQLDWGSYELIPVHPWQLEHAIPTSYASEIADRLIVALPHTLPCSPTVSLRTLATPPGADGRRRFLKVSLAALITTTHRNISPATTVNGPATSALLRDIIDAEPLLRERIDIMSEHAGCHFDASPSQPGIPAVAQRARNLSVIVRDDLTDLIHGDEIAISGTSLYATSPVSARPLLVDLVDEYAQRTGISRTVAALSIFDSYSGALIPLMLTLLSRYGIGIEAHLQNTVVVFHAGQPRRLIVRDFGGMRIHTGRLHRAGVSFNAHPDSIMTVDDMAQVRAKAFHACVAANLSEIAAILAQYCGLVPAQLWSLAAARAHQTLRALAVAHPEIAGDIASDRETLFAGTLPQKSFLYMRLFPGTDRYIHRPNPLASHRR